MNKQNKTFAFLNTLYKSIDRFTELSGRAVSWLVIIMVLLVGYDVTMRYVFNQGSIAIQELEWHLFSLIFLFGAAYTLKRDEHVRLDLLYQGKHSNDRIRAWVNLLGSACILIPFCILIINSSWFFVMQSWTIQEGSPDPGGLPYRFLLKASIPLAFCFLLLQGVAEAIRSLLTILDKEQRT